ncbi:MAG: AraC family transcriptional regulator [Clostridia bacterium]|nr:AraC family transcriptional regulator [Clostridia bacterium]
MTNPTEFEFIRHTSFAYNFFLVNMLYRTPHIHKDFEICLLLDGEINLFSHNRQFCFQKGSLWIINPFQSHELKASTPALLLALQISSSFFNVYYPQIESLNFLITPDLDFKTTSNDITNNFIRIAYDFFRQDSYYELHCAGSINYLFEAILKLYPHKFIDEKEKNINKNNALRIRKITDYIDAHYEQKLLLSDIARQEALSLSYLSHFFSDSFGMPFQEYLLRIRCEKARQLLLLSNQNLLDISMSCGFSDIKYFNKGFLKQYGITPKEYRKLFIHAALPQQQKSMLTTQEFLSPKTSLIVLQKHIEKEHIFI